MDTIFIRGLEVQTLIGVYDHERRGLRPLLLDLDLGADLHAAAASDAVRDAVDYQAVRDAVVAFGAAQRFHLLEAFAEHLSRKLFAEFPIDTLRLRIAKPGAVDGVAAVGVEIHRQRGDYAVCGS
ncbi:MAG: dihydroneopterin aldolase [Stenotrophobium sp.]